MIPKIIDFFDRKVPTPIVNFISCVSGVIGILNWISSLLNKLSSETLENIPLMNWIKKIDESGMFDFISGVFIVLLFFKCCVYYRDGRNRLYEFSEAFHSLTHNYRNLEFRIKKNIEGYTAETKDIVMWTKQYTTEILDSLCEILSSVVKQPVYGCVKMIDAFEENSMSDIDQATVSIYSRSRNTPESRRNTNMLSRDYIHDNTDFMELMDHNNIRNQFYQSNLLEYDKKLRQDDHEYKNSSKNWQEKYLSTVVVPIQLSNRYRNVPKNAAYAVVGFLCLDAKRSNTFKRKHKVPICNIVKCYADLLYCVFSLYKDSLEKIESQEYKKEYIGELIIECGVENYNVGSK